MTEEPHVHTEIEGSVGKIVLNRPRVKNAFSDQTIAQIDQALVSAIENPDLRILVITGAGNTFSAGADLGWMKSSVKWSPEQNRADALNLASMLSRIEESPKPIVARIEGACFGGATGIVNGIVGATVAATVLLVAQAAAQIGFVAPRAAAETFDRRLLDDDIGKNAACLNRGARRRVIARRGQAHGAVPAERDNRLHRRLAEGTRAEHDGAAVILQRAGDDFGSRSRATIDQHDHRHAVDQIAGFGVEALN